MAISAVSFGIKRVWRESVPADLPKNQWLRYYAIWYADDIFNVLHEYDVALCLSDHDDAPSPWEITAAHVYVRGHGPGGHYRGSYATKTLDRWADAIATWRRQKRDVLVYFDNDQKAAAPKDAQHLIRIVTE